MAPDESYISYEAICINPLRISAGVLLPTTVMIISVTNPITALSCHWYRWDGPIVARMLWNEDLWNLKSNDSL